MKSFVIYGDKRSGNCLKVLYVARILGLDFTWQDVDVLAGETRQSAFLKLNPNGQIPLVEFSDGQVLSQSNAIMLYLAEISALIPTDPLQRAKMLEWLFWEQYDHEPAIAVRRFQKFYLQKDDTAIDPKLMIKGVQVLDRLEAVLTKQDWLVGTTMTIADLSLVAYTRLANEGGFNLAEYPAIGHWINRISDKVALDP